MGKNLKFSELEAEKQRIKAATAQIEQNLFTTFLNPERIVLNSASRLFRNIKINPKIAQSLSLLGSRFPIVNNLFGNAIHKANGSMEFIGKLLSIVNNPIISALVIRNKKMWMKWQLVNVGLVAVSFFFRYLRKNKK